MTGPTGEPTVVRIDAPRVEGTIPLEEIARRLQTAAQQAAAERSGPRFLTASAGTASPTEPDPAQRLAQLSELAGQLADALGDLPDGLLGDDPGRPT